MRNWSEYKSWNCQINASDSIQIDERLYKQIQLDAYKQGMTDAAEIVGNTICKNYPECGSMVCDIQHIKKQAILTARDNKKELP